MTLTAAAALIREARLRAGLSQSELGTRAGVTQSVISIYEAGRRDPGFDMMTKLITAAGASITIEYVPTSPSYKALPDTARGRKLRKHRQEILDLARKYDTSNLRVFGSVARGDDTANSDIDIAFDPPSTLGLIELGGFQRELEEILGEKVDAIPTLGLKDAIATAVKTEGIAL